MYEKYIYMYICVYVYIYLYIFLSLSFLWDEVVLFAESASLRTLIPPCHDSFDFTA